MELVALKTDEPGLNKSVQYRFWGLAYNTLMAKNQKGFHVIYILLAIILAGVGLAAWRVVAKNKQPAKSNQVVGGSQSAQTKEDPNTPPLKLKSIGFNLDYYDPATRSAG